MTTYFKEGAEFTVNSETVASPLPSGFTQGGQIAPTVATLADGRFIVTWSTTIDTQDGSGSAIKAQLFGASGEKIGVEFLVNSATLDTQSQPAVTALAGGGFVISWNTFDATQDGSGSAIKAQLFDTSGAPVGSEFLVDTQTTGTQSSPELTALASGGFVATWTSNASGDDDIKAQIFSATGAKVGTEFRVNNTFTGAQSASDVTASSNGNFIVTWSDPANGGDIRARLFSSTGTAITTDIQVHAFSSSAQSASSVTSLAGGGFVVTWTSAGVSGDSDLAVMGQIFNAAGAKVGGEFRVNTQTFAQQWQPSVTGTPDGGFIVAWRTDDDIFSGDGNSAAIKAQVFSATGAKVGGEFLVNSLASGLQTVPSLTTLSDGRVVVTWANEPAASGAVTIEAQILKPNVAPAIDSNGGGDSAAVSATEGQTAVTAVHAIDAGGGQALQYAIVGGADEAKFAINPASGALVFTTAPQAGSPTDSNGDNVYEVIVRASDGELTDTQTLLVSVTVANQAPVITSDGGGEASALSVAENALAVTTVVASDSGSDHISYSIVGGADANDFVINSATGELSFASAPDHEAPADADQDNVYQVIVAASDGSASDMQTLTVTVGNSNDSAPVIGVFQNDTIISAMAEGNTSFLTFQASDPDGDAVVFSLSGEDAASFTIDPTNGLVQFRATPDFEAPASAQGTNSYVFDVIASDGVHNDVLHVTLNIWDVDEAVVITSNGGGGTGTLTIDEGSIDVTRVVASDPEAAAISYAISGGADAGQFSIDSQTGDLRFLQAPDYESAADADGDNVYDVTVTASTATGNDGQDLSIAIGNVNDRPLIAGGTSLALSLPENQSAVTTIVGSDPDNDALLYSISGGADAALFTIDAHTGELRFVSAPDFEAPGDQWQSNFYNVTVTATDGELTAFQAVQISIANVNEGVSITSQASFGVAENGTSVGSVHATDTDGDVVSYAIAGGADAARFVINAQTGALSFIAAPNFEAAGDADGNNVYELLVGASDGSLSTTQAIAVQVGNINEAPVITSGGGGSSATLSVNENSTLVTTVAASDPEGSQTFAISGGADAGRFTINSTTGELRFINGPNFEAPGDANGDNIYQVIVAASDGALLDTQNLSVSIANVRDGLTINGTTKADTLTGGAAEDTINGLAGADTLIGNGSDDTISAGDGNDKVTGGAGSDVLTGGAGQDTFIYTGLGDSTLSSMDRILDFSHSQKDHVSLSAIDANASVAGDQAFTFIGAASFSGHAGQLRAYQSGGDTFISGDVNGDGVGDFLICVDPPTTLVASDFLL